MTDNQELLKRLAQYGYEEVKPEIGKTSESDFLNNLETIRNTDPETIHPQLQEIYIKSKIIGGNDKDQSKYAVMFCFLYENIERGFTYQESKELKVLTPFQIAYRDTQNIEFTHTHLLAHKKGQFLIIYDFTINFMEGRLINSNQKAQGFRNSSFNEEIYALPNAVTIDMNQGSRRNNFNSKSLDRYLRYYNEKYTMTQALDIFRCVNKKQVEILGSVFTHNRNEHTQINHLYDNFQMCGKLQGKIYESGAHPQMHGTGICVGSNNEEIQGLLRRNDILTMIRTRINTLQFTELGDNRGSYFPFNRSWLNPILLFKQNQNLLYTRMKYIAKIEVVKGNNERHKKIINKMLDFDENHHYDKDCYCLDCITVKIAYVEGFRYNDKMLDSGNSIVSFDEFRTILEKYYKNKFFNYTFDNFEFTTNSKFNNVQDLTDIETIEKADSDRLSIYDTLKYFLVEYKTMYKANSGTMQMNIPFLNNFYSVYKNFYTFRGFYLYDMNLKEWVLRNELGQYRRTIRNNIESYKTFKKVEIAEENRFDKKSSKLVNKAMIKFNHFNYEDYKEYIDTLENFLLF